jgi:glutaredoxin
MALNTGIATRFLCSALTVFSLSATAQECTDENGDPLPESSCQSSYRMVVECIEPDGSYSYRDACPPGMTTASEKKLFIVGAGADSSMAGAAAAAPIIFYTVPDCDACDLTRNAFTSRNIPFTEVNVQDDAEAQETMRAKTGGLTVPTAVIGQTAVSGYNRDSLDNALRNAGYPIADASKPAAAPEEVSE